jgi:hypothetical protein
MATQANYKAFFDGIMKDIDVAIIIPCVGVCHAGYFGEMSDTYVNEMI